MSGALFAKQLISMYGSAGKALDAVEHQPQRLSPGAKKDELIDAIYELKRLAAIEKSRSVQG